MTFNRALWEGDGLDTDALDLLADLGCLPFEVRALYDACKREAWVYEQAARFQDGETKEFHLVVARYLWRRAQRFKELANELDEDETLYQEGRHEN